MSKKLTAELVGSLLQDLHEGMGVWEVREKYGVSAQTVSGIRTGKSWWRVRPDIPRAGVKRRLEYKQVREILLSEAADAELACQFGVTALEVYRIRQGIRYGGVYPELLRKGDAWRERHRVR